MDEFGQHPDPVAEGDEGEERNEPRPQSRPGTRQAGSNLENGRPQGPQQEKDDAGCCKCIIM